jgi:hypothetical protein
MDALQHMCRPVVIIYSLEHGRAALAAAAALAVPVALRSPDGAALSWGAPLFRDMVATAAAAFPTADVRAVLDCGDAPGVAANAFRHGITAVRLQARPEVLAKIAGIAGQRDGEVVPWTSPAPILDLRDVDDAPGVCRQWLAALVSASYGGAALPTATGSHISNTGVHEIGEIEA